MGGGVLVRIYFIDVYVSCDICIVYVECKVERVYKLQLYVDMYFDM